MSTIPFFLLKIKIISLFLLIFLSNYGFCVTTWDGSSSTSWSTAANWDTGVVPTSATDVVISSTPVNQPTISAATNANSRNLTIDNGATLTNAATTGALNIYGNFTNNGTFNHTGNASQPTYMNGANKTLGGTGTFTTTYIDFVCLSSTTLSSDVTIKQAYLNYCAGAVTTSTLNLSTFHLTMTGDFYQVGNLNLNSGIFEMRGIVYNGVVSRWNSGTGLFYENLTSGGPFNWQATGGYTFYDYTVNCPGQSYKIAANVTVTRHMIISGGTLNIEGYTLNVGGDFTNNGTFTASAGGTVNLNGTSAQILGGTSTTSFYNLTLNNAAGVTFGNSATIADAGTLTLTSGYHNLASYTLQVGTSSSTTSQLTYTAGGLYSSTNNGSFARFFPIGAITSTSGKYYGLFPFKKSATLINVFELNSTSNVTTAGLVTATPGFASTVVDFTDYADDHGTVDKNKNGKAISLTIGTLAGGVFDVKLTSGTFGSSVLSDFTLVTYTASSPSYKGTFVATTGTSTVPIVARTAVNTVDLTQRWVLGTYNFALTSLPIELLSFSGKNNSNNNELQWKTLTESDNSFFTIEKTYDGINFEFVGNQNAAGTTSQMSDCKLIDYDVRNTINYYRLKQTDFDGKFQFSDLISIDNSTNKSKEEIILITNLIGQEINTNYSGIVIIYFSNGTSRKTIQ